MSNKKTLISVAIGSAFAATLVSAPVSAAENPFVVQTMDSGYIVADAGKHGDKKTGEGKCGTMKAGEGSCGNKASEGKCGAAMADINKDGKITQEEWNKHHDAMFEQMDVNKDGVLDDSELKKGGAAKKGY